MAEAVAHNERGRVRLLTQVQAVSGLTFLTFVALHLFNTFLAAASPETYDAFQSLARTYYQHAVIEPVLMLALTVHATVGVIRLRDGRRPTTWRQRLHRYSGVFLLVFVFGHIASVRGPSLLAGVYPGSQGVSFSLAFAPALFYPYYFLLGLAGLYHGWRGAALALERLGVSWPDPLSDGIGFWLVPAVGGCLIVAALLGLGGWLYPIMDPFDNDFARLYLSIIGD